MKKLFYLLVVGFALFPLSAFALITGSASTDSIGNVNYTFSDGTSGYSYKDSIGYTRYQFSDGMYGSAYTDSVGATHYYFDEASKKIYMNGSCIYPTAGSCMYESQYQEMYDKAAQGLPSCSNQSGEFGSFSVPAEYCTPEGKEKLIMSGSYGSWLKMCRESIDSYVKFKASYDACVKEQNAKYEQIAQMKLNILKQQLDNERQRLELEKLKTQINQQQTIQQPTCPTKTHYSLSSKMCVCEKGLVWDKNSQDCVSCPANAVTEVYGDLTVCSYCSEGYVRDSISKKCVKKEVPTINKVEEVKPLENKAVKITPIKNVPSVKNEDIKKPTTTIDNVTSSNQVENKKEVEQAQNTVVEQPKKVGVFQGVSGFFRKIFIKIKFW